MKAKIAMVSLLLLLFIGVASAYQYTDSDGRIHIVSDSVAVRHADGDTVANVSDGLHSISDTDKEFVRLVHLYISKNIEYVSDGGWQVKSPDKTIQDLSGDCSEMALLEVAMLTRHGVDAVIIYGVVPGVGLHDAVEVHLDHYYYRTDAIEQPAFSKIGDGLHPDEKISY